MNLFTVSFTTKKKIQRFDHRGKMTSEESFDTPVVMTALPHSTALTYSGCDNYKIIPYVMEERRKSSGGVRDYSVGNGTKKVTHRQTEAGTKSSHPKSTATVAKSKVAQAAATGDMAAALNT